MAKSLAFPPPAAVFAPSAPTVDVRSSALALAPIVFRTRSATAANSRVRSRFGGRCSIMSTAPLVAPFVASFAASTASTARALFASRVASRGRSRASRRVTECRFVVAIGFDAIARRDEWRRCRAPSARTSSRASRRARETTGRALDDHRACAVTLRAVPSASGSAAVALGDGANATRCVVAVRADVTAVRESDDDQDCGRVVVRVDASATVETREGGNERAREEAAENLGATYARALESVLIGREAVRRREGEEAGDEDGAIARGMGKREQFGIDLKSLCVKPGRARWTLTVDCACACDRGSMLDALSVGVRAALADTKIPKVTVAGVGEDGAGGELEIDDDPEACSRVDVSRCGVVVTTTKIGRHGVVDATEEEAACSEATMSVGVDREGTICAEFGAGGESLDRGTAQAMRKLACKVGVELIEHMDGYLARAIAVDVDDDDEGDDRVLKVKIRR